jgi:IS5 family transposase
MTFEKSDQLSDDEMAFQLYDRLSFRQFVGLRELDRFPDSKTIGLFKNGLAASGAHLEVLGYRAQKGQLIDASIQ